MNDRVDIECVLDAKAGVGESPLWSAAERCLWWVDIVGQGLHRFAPTSGAAARFSLADQPACVALAGEHLLLASRRGVALFDPATGEFGQHWPADYDCATTRFNDGRCDRQGRFWVGSMFEPRSSPSARLYRLDEQGLTPRIGNLTVANGLAFSPDGRTMYRADSPARVVYRHAYDPESGEVGEGEVFQATRAGPTARPWTATAATGSRCTTAARCSRSIRTGDGCGAS
jgi:sugar lactone lactonase YvrE